MVSAGADPRQVFRLLSLAAPVPPAPAAISENLLTLPARRGRVTA
jgi:hypothetical protein